MNDVEVKRAHDTWCRKIAQVRSKEELIAHFREHVGDHFMRHKNEGQLSLDVWIIGALNFLYIFEKKFPHLSKADMLYKLCRHHINSPGGAEPPFDMASFLAEYDGPIKNFHRTRHQKLAAV